MNPWSVESGNTLHERIRAWVRANPKTTATACAQALGIKRSLANGRMLSMSYDDMLVKDETSPERTYTIGRELLQIHGLPPEVAKERRRLLKASNNRQRRLLGRKGASKPVQPSVAAKPRPAEKQAPKQRCESYEAWLAAGGVPDEVLPPPVYVPPRLLPRFPTFSGENVAHG